MHMTFDRVQTQLHARIKKKVTFASLYEDETASNSVVVVVEEDETQSVFNPTARVSSCLVVGDGEPEGREFPLLAVADALALPLAVQAHVLVLARVIPHRLFVLATPSAPVARAQVLRGL